jgi:hypothetical protein
MHSRSLKIALSLIAVFLPAGILSAAECVNNVSSCTPKQLCEAATSTENGKKVWTTKSSFSKHLKVAKRIGIDCGVIEVVASCDTDADLCTFTEVCKKAVQVKGGKTNWITTTTAAPYVAIAKKYGMSCGVNPNFVVQNKKCVPFTKKLEEIEPCTNEELCVLQTSSGSMRGALRDFSSNAAEKEALKRGISCGVFQYDKLVNNVIQELLYGLNSLYRYRHLQAPLMPNVVINGVQASAQKPIDEILLEQFHKTSEWPYGLYEVNKKETSLKCNTESNTEIIFFPFWCSLKFVASWSDVPPVFMQGLPKSQEQRPQRRIFFDAVINAVLSSPDAREKTRRGIPEFHAYEFKISKLNSRWNELNNVPITEKTVSRPLVLSIQKELNRVGCDVGAADGRIGPKTRSGLFNFSEKASIEFELQLLNDPNFLKLLKSFRSNTCPKIEKRKEPVNANSSTSKTDITASIASRSELQALRLERQQIEANLLAMQDLYQQQERAANSRYKMCLSNCMMNNKAGKGFAAALSGMGQCNSSCAPLKYGEAVVPPSWERNQRRLQTIDCTITQLSRNQATARCNEF